MALRAGYYGLKKKIINDINTLITKFTDAVVIKSIGEGLVFDSSGELSAVSSGGVDYSTTEQNTGIKWIDGKDIYQKTISANAPYQVYGNAVDLGVEVDRIVKVVMSEYLYNGDYYYHNNAAVCKLITSEGNPSSVSFYGNITTVDITPTIYYTKAGASKSKKGGKK